MHNLSCWFLSFASVLAGYFSSLLALHLLALSMLIRFLIPTTFSFLKIRNFNFLKVNTSSTIILCAIRGLVIFFSQYLLYLAIHSLGLASGLILYNLGPIILIIIFTLLGNKLKKQDIVLITLSFIGVLVFFDFELKMENIGVIYGIIAAVLYAVSQYINADMARHNADPKTIILLVNFSATIVAAIYLVFFVGPLPKFTGFHIATWLIIAAMGLATYFNQYFRIIAFKLVENPNTIVYLTYFCIPFSLIFTFFEGQIIAPYQLYGGLIILGGALTQTYLVRKKSPTSKLMAESLTNQISATEPSHAN